jgi:hypothetical protein
VAINLPFACPTCGKRFLNLLGARKHKCPTQKENEMTDTQSLVERLRDSANYDRPIDPRKLCIEAADLIERAEAALIAAERRGIEKAAKVASELDDYSGAYVASRIRALAGEEGK